MVQFLRGWFNPAPPPNYPQQRSSALSDTIVAIALSALALITANTFDRQAPGLAALLRCVPIGMTLFWFFRRCIDGNGYDYHDQEPVVVVPHHVPSPPRRYWNWNNWFPQTQLHPAPLYQAPFSPQSHTNYSHANHGHGFTYVHPIPPPPGGGGFPPVHRAAPNPQAFPDVYVPSHGRFPPVQRAAPNPQAFANVHQVPVYGGFPPVQRVAVQGDGGAGRPMFPAAVSR